MIDLSKITFNLTEISEKRFNKLTSRWEVFLNSKKDTKEAFTIHEEFETVNPHYVVGLVLTLDDLGPLAGIIGAKNVKISFGLDEKKKWGKPAFRALFHTVNSINQRVSPFFEATEFLIKDLKSLKAYGNNPFVFPNSPFDSIGTGTGLIPRSICNIQFSLWLEALRNPEKMSSNVFKLVDDEVLKGYTFSIREVRNSLLLGQRDLASHLNVLFLIKNLNISKSKESNHLIPAKSSFDVLLMCDSCEHNGAFLHHSYSYYDGTVGDGFDLGAPCPHTC